MSQNKKNESEKVCKKKNKYSELQQWEREKERSAL